MAGDKVVLLGLLDEEVGEYGLTWSSSKLGGNPDWICSATENPSCGECGRDTTLITQIYCPLEGKPFHRTLYLFACCNPSCWNKPNSWRILRGQQVDQDYRTQTTSPQTKKESLFDVEDDWGDGADDWGENSNHGNDWGDNTNSNHGNDWDENTNSNHGTCTNSISMETTSSGDHLKDESLCSISVEDADNIPSDGTKEATSLLNQMSIDDVNLAPVSQNDVTPVNHPLNDSDVESMSECCAEDFAVQPESQFLKDLLASNAEKSGDKNSKEASRRVEFKSYFVSVIEEPASDETEKLQLKHEQKLLKEYTSREGCDVGEFMPQKSRGKDKAGESYEKSSARHGDRTFYKFQKRISLCPHQILRYSWSGTPLFITNPGANVSVPPCATCGAKRVFELQLLPSLINFLRTDGESDKTVEFGTVLVYTCSSACWDDSNTYREECCVIQADPDLDFLSKKTKT